MTGPKDRGQSRFPHAAGPAASSGELGVLPGAVGSMAKTCRIEFCVRDGLPSYSLRTSPGPTGLDDDDVATVVDVLSEASVHVVGVVLCSVVWTAGRIPGRGQRRSRTGCNSRSFCRRSSASLLARASAASTVAQIEPGQTSLFRRDVSMNETVVGQGHFWEPPEGVHRCLSHHRAIIYPWPGSKRVQEIAERGP